MTKAELRKKYLNVRDKIQNRDLKNKLILDFLLGLEEVKKASLILTYVSFDSEVDTIEFIKEMLKEKSVAVPKIEGDQMKFYLISSLDELKMGTFNILEPTTNQRVTDFSNSICVVPGVCFNSSGYRIGYGKGYYDKFLANYPGYTIGLCYQECLIEDSFQEERDIKVKQIVFK